MHLIDPSPRAPLLQLIEQGALQPEQIPAALELTQLHPDRQRWHKFIDLLLLWLGGLALVFALMFFIAYNWSNIGHFAKFAMVELFIAASVAAYYKWQRHPMVRKLALFVASVGLGILLALFGQTYQTGADPWELFFNWALLILPWTLLARFPALWMLWLGLLNLSVILYFQTFRNTISLLFPSDITLMWILFFLNTSALVSWELLAKKLTWLNASWATRIIVVAAGVAATWLAFYGIFEREANLIMHLVAWLAFMVALLGYYRYQQPDLFMLAGACLSAIAVVVALMIDKLFSTSDDGSSLLLIALVIIGLSATAAVWLRKVHKELDL